MAEKLPWFKMFAKEWRTNMKLRRCSLAARGLWIDLLCMMHECEERGVLITGNRPWTDCEISAAVGGDNTANLTVLHELLDKGVAKRDNRNAIYSSRMVRDESKRSKCSEAGLKGGGNPTFKGLSKGHPKGRPKGQSKGASDSYISDSLNLSLEKGERVQREGETAPETAIPPPLNTQAFRDKWRQWQEFRKENRWKTLKPRSVEAQFRELEAWGHERAIAAIEQSIRNGWQGLFEPKPAASQQQAFGSAPAVRAKDRSRDRGDYPEPDAPLPHL